MLEGLKVCIFSKVPFKQLQHQTIPPILICHLSVESYLVTNEITAAEKKRGFLLRQQSDSESESDSVISPRRLQLGQIAYWG